MALEPPCAGDTVEANGEGLISVGKDFKVLGAIPMLTSAVPSVARSLTPVCNDRSVSRLGEERKVSHKKVKLTTEDFPAVINLSLLD